MTAPQIITQRTKAGLEVWLSQNALMRFCPTLSDGYLRVVRSYNKSGRVTQWNNIQQHGTYYYEYSSIPNKKPAMYASMLPTRSELIELANQPATATDTTLELEAKQFIGKRFTDYLPNYKHRPAQQAINLARACAMIDWMCQHIEATEMDTRPMGFFIQCCEIIRNLEIRYLPDEAYRNLKFKVLQILDGKASIVESVRLPREGNDYAASHREDLEIISWIYTLRDSGRNYSNEFIIRKVWQACDKAGKPRPSDRWIGGIMEQHETQYLTSAGRYGADGKYNRQRRSIPTANALFAGDCWEIDSTKVNMVGHRNEEGKHGQMLKIVAVRDVYSGDIVGRSYDIAENRWAYIKALQNAVQNTGYLPYEIRHDRFPGHNSEEIINLLSDLRFMNVKTTEVRTANGKQRLERWFSTMQQIALQESDYYTGEGIMSNRKAAHISEERKKAVVKLAKQNGWDFDQAINETNTHLNRFLNTPYSEYSNKYASIDMSPVQLHEQSEKPNVIAVNERQLAYLFGHRKTLAVRNNGQIRHTINHVEFIYQITDPTVIQRYGKVLCCYDVEDLSKVHIYAPGKEAMKVYLGVAEEFIPIQIFGPDAEWGRMAKVRAMYSEIEQARKDELVRKKVANGEEFYDYEAAVMYPRIVNKSLQESAETIITNQHFGFDDGEDLNVDVTHQL